MCGIAGLISENATGKDALASMLEKMTFRGPDSKGTYFEAPFFGGMRRLSINDLITGDQPLYNSDKSIVVFYNVEIYNFK